MNALPAASTTISLINKAVDEAMAYLEPPSDETLTLKSVAHAYTILQHAAAAAAESSATATANDDRCHRSLQLHPRLQRIFFILNNKEKEEETTTSNRRNFDDNSSASTNNTMMIGEWMSAQADLYRALLLTSVLWLELMSSQRTTTTTTSRYSNKVSVAAAAADPAETRRRQQPTTARILQSSVERSFLLLQVLEESYCGGDDPSTNLLMPPPSRFALLQAVLDEPLVPLNKRERQYMYLMQHTERSAAASVVGNTGNNDPFVQRQQRQEQHYQHEDEDDMDSMIAFGGDDDDDNNVMVGLERKRLVREEQELIKLASKPIPTNTNSNAATEQHLIRLQHGDGDTATTTDSTCTAATRDGSVVLHEGPLEQCCIVVCHSDDDNNKRDMDEGATTTTIEPCHVQVYACGLIVVIPTTREERQMGEGLSLSSWSAAAWLLTCDSKCEHRVIPSHEEQRQQQQQQQSPSPLSSVHMIDITKCLPVTTACVSSRFGVGVAANNAAKSKSRPPLLPPQIVGIASSSTTAAAISPPATLQFRLHSDDLSSFHTWTNVVIPKVMKTLQKAYKLQNDIEVEWDAAGISQL